MVLLTILLGRMAETTLSALFQAALDRLDSLIPEDFGLFRSLHQDIEKLKRSLSTILAVLEHADQKQYRDGNEVKNWLKKVKYVAYDVDEILDQYATEALRRKMETEGRLTKKLLDFFSDSNTVAFHLRMAYKIKDIRERLRLLANERLNLQFRRSVSIFDTKYYREKTDSFIDESNVHGRGEDIERVVKLLLDVGCRRQVSVIPVVGMGGLGKTTLAQLVYNDARVKGHFHLKIWVCVSNGFDVERVMTTILDSAIRRNNNFKDGDLQQSRFLKKMSKRILLVLDDVWDENPNNWKQFKNSLPISATGSKIIVTTRSEKVASIMGTHPPLHLGRLSDENCWSLFKQQAFGHGREENPNLIILGKEIVKKCSGLPLAAEALGKSLCSKKEEREWEFIKETEVWNLPEEDNCILPVLKLSYYHLPSQLKQCFAYCSIFPKGHPIKAKELIQLWMAEGFVQPTKASKRMEDIGREYFKNLLWWSFFQEPEKDDDGNVASYKMHDLMHDLAMSVSGDAYSMDVKDGNMTSIPDGCRHLSLVCSSYHEGLAIDWTASNKAEKLRTLLALTSEITMLSRNFSIHASGLRVLDLSYMDVTKDMLNSISRLKHLRYLHLSRVQILPESFSKLHNLQTLRLTSCRELELPKDVRRMINLRHLEISPPSCLTDMPAKIGQLKFLQTLSVFVVGKDSESDIRELRELNLGGELTIRKLENVRSQRSAREAGLNEKPELQSLTLSWSNYIDADMRSNEGTLKALKPHPNLKFFRVENYNGKRFPRWMSSTFLQKLTKVSLSNCRGCDNLPSFGQLPSLKFLHISGIHALKCIDSHFYGDRAFPLLEDLIFQDMPNLEEWSESNLRQAFPRLKRITVIRCPKLIDIPRFPSLCSLTIVNFGADTLQELWIEGPVTLMPLRRQGFTSLRSLITQQRHNLVSFIGEMQHLTALERLLTDVCPELGSLASLKSLSIGNCHKATSLPEVIKHVLMLQDLYVNDLQTLAALPEWIGNLYSLQSLEIRHCPRLASLPSALQHLTDLRFLTIEDCPQLENRCQVGTGEDWHKIAHIPNIQIRRLLI